MADDTGDSRAAAAMFPPSYPDGPRISVIKRRGGDWVASVYWGDEKIARGRSKSPSGAVERAVVRFARHAADPNYRTGLGEDTKC